MDRNSFLRGFGTGVLFTAIILGISCLIRTSDSSVVRRARALGMVYEEAGSVFDEKERAVSGSAAETEKTTGQGDTSTADKAQSGKSTNASKETASPSGTDENKNSSDDQKKDGNEEIKETFDKEKKKAEQEFEEAERSFSVQAGEWSSIVSDNLEAQGLIEDASAFDAYLEEYGYSSRIRAGNYTIPEDATFEEIAKILTGQ